MPARTRIPVTAAAYQHVPETKWDRGRRLLSIIKLSAGMGIVATSVASIFVAAALREKSSDFAEIAIALSAALIAFVYFSRRFHIFVSHRGDDKGDDRHLE